MSTPSRWFRQLLMLLSFVALSGCGGCARIPTAAKPKVQEEDPLLLAKELYRSASEYAHYRDANERVNTALADKPDALARHYPGTADRAELQALLRGKGTDVDKLDDHALYRQFLTTIIGLDKAEVDEVESSSFKLMDAHYLDSCYLLRNAARSMPLDGLSPLEQAKFCLAWVTRQIVLQEDRPDLLPPQFVLRRGQGSAAERALVFLALLQQLTPPPDAEEAHIDGCVIALPAKDGQPQPWLVGVLITTQKRHEVYLFDPRLGLPVPGPMGKGVATLAQLRKTPALLDGLKLQGSDLRYDVEAKQVALAELLVACPLSGLSPRMRYLEEELLAQESDRINVAIRAAESLEKFGKLDLGPVRVWSGTGALSPIRALRTYLPVAEGGVDDGRRLLLFEQSLLPLAAIQQAYHEERLSLADLQSKQIEVELLKRAVALWGNYAVAPAAQLRRGQLDDCTKRLVRAQKALADALGKNPNLAQIDKWRSEVQRAYVNNDGVRIAEIWGDPWLSQLLTMPDEEPAQPLPKGLLSDIVLWAVGKPLHAQCNYLLALRWQEKAERLQALADMAAAGNGNDAEKARAREDSQNAWRSAELCWAGYASDNPLTTKAVRDRLDVVEQHKKANRQDLAAGLLEHCRWQIRQAAAAKLMHVRAQALGQPGKTDAAMTTLKRLVNEVTGLEKETALGLGTSLFWVRYAAELQLVEWQRKQK